MNKDRIKGESKDIAGRVQRQVGEWTGDTEAQVKGAAKQVEGKVQNAWGKAKDAAKDAAKEQEKAANENRKASLDEEIEAEKEDSLRRRAS